MGLALDRIRGVAMTVEGRVIMVGATGLANKKTYNGQKGSAGVTVTTNASVMMEHF